MSAYLTIVASIVEREAETAVGTVEIHVPARAGRRARSLLRGTSEISCFGRDAELADPAVLPEHPRVTASAIGFRPHASAVPDGGR